MKICPICEKKIEGSFCTSCFRFVTPWNISDNTYINKSHDGRKDKNCEYHNPKTEYSRQEYMRSGYEKRIYGGSTSTKAAQGRNQTPPAKPNPRGTSGTRQNQQGTSKAKAADSGKQLKSGLIICIILLVIGAVAAFVEIGYIKLSEFSWTPEPEREPTGTNTVTNEAVTVYDDSKSIEGYLRTISFAEEKSCCLGTYYYYAPEDIVGLTEYHCDLGHFDMTANEFFEKFTEFYGEEPLETEEISVPENNYLLDAAAGKNSIRLETEYNWDYDTFNIKVSADTASGELHGYEFVCSDADDAFYHMIYLWCNEEMPGRFASAEDLRATLSANSGYLNETAQQGFCFKVFQMSGYLDVKFVK